MALNPLTTNAEGAPEGIPAPETTKALPAAVQLRNEVKQAVDAMTSNGTIRNRLVEQLVEVELKRRTDILTQGLTKRKEMEREINKIKPDHVLVNETGQRTVEAFTVPKQKELQKAKEKLNKFDKTLEAALVNASAADFDKLEQALKGGGGDNNKNEEDQSE